MVDRYCCGTIISVAVLPYQVQTVRPEPQSDVSNRKNLARWNSHW
jgi:hypothetical protein